MDNPKTITLDELLTHVENGDSITPDPNRYDGHVLTIEHYGRYPVQDLRRNYFDLLSTALGEPDDFSQYSLVIESHWTVIRRTDIPVAEFGTKQDMESQANSGLLPRTQRRVFEAAAADMDATVQELAQTVGVSTDFVHRTLSSA